MERQIVDGIEKKSKYVVSNLLYILVAIAISISVLLLFSSNFNVSFMGNIPTFSTAVEAVVFLVVWLFYGMVMGYMRENNSFIKFISFYWGISGLIFLFANIMSPIGKFAIIVIPVWLINSVPIYGLGYFMQIGSHKILFGIAEVTSPWLAGAIGYVLGYLLKKLMISTLSNK